jgi:hypothetical protein
MPEKPPLTSRPGCSSAAFPVPLDAIQEAVESIRYGVVQLIIQDGRVVQIDKTEKIRLA